MKAHINDIKVALPKNLLIQEKWTNRYLELVGAYMPAQERILKTVVNQSCINYRYSVIDSFSENFANDSFFKAGTQPSTSDRQAIYKKEALPLLLQAVEQYSPEELAKTTHIITVSCTGMYAPGLDLELLWHLKLSPETFRTSVNFMGCYAAVHGLYQAQQIVKANPEARVLLACIELCSLHFDAVLHSEAMITNSLFADGAAAVIISAEEKGYAMDRFYPLVMDDGATAMSWDIGNSGFKMELSPEVPQLIKKHLPAYIAKHFPNNPQLDGLELCFHPGGPAILRTLAQCFNKTDEALADSWKIFEECGNMSSVTLLFVLHRKMAHLPIGKELLAAAFGPGLTMESFTAKWLGN